MTTRPLLGAHLSTSGGLAAMIDTAVSLGAHCAQIFTSSPQQWRAKHYTPEEVAAFQAARAAADVAPIISHESYLINLASSDPELLAKSRQAFSEEIVRCGQLRLPMVVIHWGSYKGGTLDDGMARLAESLNACLPQAEDAGVQIVLETTAGQGAYLGGEFAQFSRLFALVPHYERLGVCLDTAHAYAAGYDLRDAAAYAALWEAFTRDIPLSMLKVIHVNDTDKALGSHADRHAGIGQGQLGQEAFRLLLHDARLADVPKILETPGGLEMHAENLSLLRELAR